MKEKYKKQSNHKIESLGQLSIFKMLENKFLTKQKERYTNQINFIKNFLSNNSKPNNCNINNSSNNNLTYQ